MGRRSSGSSCGEQIRSDSTCACQRLQEALNAQSEKLESNASSLFARLRLNHLGKITSRDGFFEELNGLRTELEKLAHDSCQVYAKLGKANRKIVGFHFIHWVRQKTEQDLSKVLDEHFNPWVHFTFQQYMQEEDRWLAPRWFRGLLPDGEEQDDPESMLHQDETVRLLYDIRLTWIDDSLDAAIDMDLDELRFETKIADACAPQIPDAEAEEPSTRAAEFDHSDDYRSLSFKRRSHSLTHNQAIIVRILHEEYLLGFPEVSNTKLLKGIESETSRVRDSFKNSPLWGTLVKPGSRKGFYRLSLADRQRQNPPPIL